MIDNPEVIGVGSLFLLAIIGSVAGLLNTIAGGGSMLSLPALLFLEIPSSVANGTNRLAIIAQALPASIVFFRNGFSNLKRSLFLGLTLIPGAVIGAHLGTKINDIIFDKIVAVILGITFISMMLRRRYPESTPHKSLSSSMKRPLLVYFLIFLLGFYGGFIHIGIGFLIMFILHRLGGLHLIETNTHKILIVVPYSIISLFIFWTESSVIWLAGVSLAVGNMLGGWIGAHITMKDGGKYIVPFYQATILIIIIGLVLR